MDNLKQEALSFRIVRKHIKKIVNALPFESMSQLNYKATVELNVTNKQIYDMYEELYIFVGRSSYLQMRKSLKSEKYFSATEYAELIKEWLIQNAGVRIVSVRDTLVEKIIAIIGDGYTNGLTIEQTSRLLMRTFGWYRYQAIRIARTETTTGANASIYIAGEESPYEVTKQWISAVDNRTRLHHVELNRVIVDFDTKFKSGTALLRYPGDIDVNAPGDIINCRCRMVLKGKRDSNGMLIHKIKK